MQPTAGEDKSMTKQQQYAGYSLRRGPPMAFHSDWSRNVSFPQQQSQQQRSTRTQPAAPAPVATQKVAQVAPIPAGESAPSVTSFVKSMVKRPLDFYRGAPLHSTPARATTRAAAPPAPISAIDDATDSLALSAKVALPSATSGPAPAVPATKAIKPAVVPHFYDMWGSLESQPLWKQAQEDTTAAVETSFASPSAISAAFPLLATTTVKQSAWKSAVEGASLAKPAMPVPPPCPVALNGPKAIDESDVSSASDDMGWLEEIRNTVHAAMEAETAATAAEAPQKTDFVLEWARAQERLQEHQQ